jgi:glutathione S-transferase
MLKIWGRVNSINVMKVLWCADELGLDYERADAGMAFGQVDEAWYRAMNPNGLVPTIEDDGRVLWESNAIVRYLCARYGQGSLYPEDAGVRAEGDRWMDWQLSTLHNDMTYLFWGLVRNAPDKQDPAEQAAAAGRVNALWSYVDAALADRAFLAGDALSMGDIPLGCVVHRWLSLPGYPGEYPDLPHLQGWYRRLGERDAYRRWVAVPLT